MLKQPFVQFLLAGVSLTDYGLKIPSPFTSLELSNSEITSMTSWTLNCTVGGDSDNKINIASFEALLYSAAQSASSYANSSGIPVSFIFGWLDDKGQISEHLSYQGFTLQFKVTTSGMYMNYQITGYASLAQQSNAPVLRIPEVSGVVQPSAVLVGLAEALNVTSYYKLDIDRNDSPTLVHHGALTTSFNSYVRGSYTGQDNYEDFPGLLKLSKSYNGTRDAAGLITTKAKKLSQVLNNVITSSVSNFLKKSLTDNTTQCSSFSYWVDEPTMTQPGTIHYKSNASISTSHLSDTLEYGTANTNILSISGSYNGVSYNISNMNFSQVGFTVDASGNAIAQGGEVVNSWSSSLADVYQTSNIINDINALATQFTGDFTIQIPGSVNKYELAQPISLLVMSQGTISPITGIYSIISVSHEVSTTYITTLKVQRLVMSSANEVATSQNILVAGSSNQSSAYTTTSNILSPYKTNFGQLYPKFSDLFSTSY